MNRTLTVLLVTLALALSPALGVAGATETTSATADGTDTRSLADVPDVTMANQTTGGTTVVVEEVTLPEGGFVAIHDASLNEGGASVLSSVAGTSAYLQAGTHENVTVTLDEPISEDATLVAMPHRDTDGDRIYEFVASGGSADGPYTADGDVVVDTAAVTASAALNASDQPSDGSTLILDRVELATGGFVTVHDGSLLDGAVIDSVRGTSEYLEAGVHENVVVNLDEPYESNGTAIPMAHLDTNGNERYDFVTSSGETDGPYTDAGGDIVLETANVTVGAPASATFDDQVSGGNEVVLEAVFLPDGGFVTMHDATLQDGAVFDSVRGTSEYLEPGLHRHVHVALDEPLEENASLVAMPHRDTNGDESYDFVTSEGSDDGPYTDGGDIVVDSANVTVSAGISIVDQSSDGTTVRVHVADLSEGGFVTIHDASLGAGEVLGSVRGTSAYLEPGTAREVTVTLDEPLTTTTDVVAMAHRDTDGDETYDFLTSEGSEDGPYTAAGDIVMDGARISVQSQLTFEAQETRGNELVVRSVTLHDGGFVTIHDGSLLDGEAFGSVRGTSTYLGPGTHENVTVALDTPVEEDGTFIAMPHRDTDGDESYDFLTSEGSDDGPYTATGGAVLAPANVSVAPTADVALAEQRTNGEEVTVESVTMSQGGFVTVHDGSLQNGEVFASVRGTSDYLEAGTHEDVTVTLEEPIEESGSFIAMPHLDTNGNERYDFVSSEGSADGPYTTAGGDVVVDTGTVTVGEMNDGTATAEPSGEAEATETTGGDGPGFGLVVAVLAVVAVAALVARR